MPSPCAVLTVGRRVAQLLALLGVALQAAVSEAQITTAITPSWQDTAIAQSGSIYAITGGRRAGSNLFHSFGLFSVGAGDTARFKNTTPELTTKNILTRVTTPGEPSNIFGTIDTLSYPGANLFLLNPAGVMFGPRATLKVGGSFHVSTAHYLGFGEGEPKFSAQPVKGELLSAAPPAAFGFLGPAAPISIEGSTLRVPAGQTLSVVGGNIAIGATRATLAAPGGQVQIVSVASPGEVTLSPPGQALSMDSFTRFGTIDLSGQAVISTSGGGAGTVFIRGGQLTLDNSFLLSDTSGKGAPVGIHVQADEGVVLKNGALMRTSTSGGGSAGDIVLNSRDLTVTGGAQIRSETSGAGQGGKIDITVNDLVDLSGRIVAKSSGIFSASTQTGRGGNIMLTLGRLHVESGAQISSVASGNGGQGGEVRVTARDSVLLSGGGSRETGILSSGLGDLGRVAPAGIIWLDVGSLTLTGGAEIRSGSVVTQGADVTIRARDVIDISDASRISSQAFLPQRSAQVSVSTPATLTMDNGFISTSTSSAARAGEISVHAGRLTLTHGAEITSSEVGAQGPAGKLTVQADESVVITGSRSGLFSTASGSGPAGQVRLEAPTLALSDGARIAVTTVGADPRATAGDVAVNVGKVSLTGGASIDSSSAGAGHGGNVTITATDSISISDASGLFSNAEGTGPGGNLHLRAAELRLTDGATISARSTGTVAALAGNVNIAVGDTFRMRNSTITTDAGVADGGNISLTGGHLVYLLNSGITASVAKAKGNGGNITIDPQFVVLDHSQLRADAFGGRGGNITIVSDFFLTNPFANTAADLMRFVSASSALSTQGTISIQSRFTDVSSSVAPLPAGLARAATLLRASCAARVAAGKASSLVVAGREGVPLEPGDYVPSPMMTGEPGSVEPSQSGAPSVDSLPRLSLSVFAPACSR